MTDCDCMDSYGVFTFSAKRRRVAQRVHEGRMARLPPTAWTRVDSVARCLI